MDITRELPDAKVASGNMLDIGGFGQIAEPPEGESWPEPIKFPWFGAEVRVNPNISDTAIADFVESIGDMEDDDPNAIVVVKTFVRTVIHPADFDDFWELGKQHGYSMNDFSGAAGAIITAVTGDPTKGSADLSAGPSGTVTKLTAVSSKRADIIHDLEGEHRPDLAEFYLLAKEAGVAH